MSRNHPIIDLVLSLYSSSTLQGNAAYWQSAHEKLLAYEQEDCLSVYTQCILGYSTSTYTTETRIVFLSYARRLLSLIPSEKLPELKLYEVYQLLREDILQVGMDQSLLKQCIVFITAIVRLESEKDVHMYFQELNDIYPQVNAAQAVVLIECYGHMVKGYVSTMMDKGYYAIHTEKTMRGMVDTFLEMDRMQFDGFKERLGRYVRGEEEPMAEVDSSIRYCYHYMRFYDWYRMRSTTLFDLEPTPALDDLVITIFRYAISHGAHPLAMATLKRISKMMSSLVGETFLPYYSLITHFTPLAYSLLLSPLGDHPITSHLFYFLRYTMDSYCRILGTAPGSEAIPQEVQRGNRLVEMIDICLSHYLSLSTPIMDQFIHHPYDLADQVYKLGSLSDTYYAIELYLASMMSCYPHIALPKVHYALNQLVNHKEILSIDVVYKLLLWVSLAIEQYTEAVTLPEDVIGILDGCFSLSLPEEEQSFLQYRCLLLLQQAIPMLLQAERDYNPYVTKLLIQLLDHPHPLVRLECIVSWRVYISTPGFKGHTIVPHITHIVERVICLVKAQHRGPSNLPLLTFLGLLLVRMKEELAYAMGDIFTCFNTMWAESGENPQLQLDTLTLLRELLQRLKYEAYILYPFVLPVLVHVTDIEDDTVIPLLGEGLSLWLTVFETLPSDWEEVCGDFRELFATHLMGIVHYYRGRGMYRELAICIRIVRYYIVLYGEAFIQQYQSWFKATVLSLTGPYLLRVDERVRDAGWTSDISLDLPKGMVEEQEKCIRQCMKLVQSILLIMIHSVPDYHPLFHAILLILGYGKHIHKSIMKPILLTMSQISIENSHILVDILTGGEYPMEAGEILLHLMSVWYATITGLRFQSDEVRVLLISGMCRTLSAILTECVWSSFVDLMILKEFARSIIGLVKEANLHQMLDPGGNRESGMVGGLTEAVWGKIRAQRPRQAQPYVKECIQRLAYALEDKGEPVDQELVSMLGALGVE